MTSTIVFEEGGQLREYVGGYSDWLRQGHELAEADRHAAEEASGENIKTAVNAEPVKKLSYKEQRELDGLPKKIEELELLLAGLQEQVSASNFYSQGHEITKPVLDAISETQETLDLALERWSALEDKVRRYQSSRK